LVAQRRIDGADGKLAERMSYISKLTTARRSRYQSEPGQARPSAIVESWSVGEGAMLKLIADGQSNKEIARSLIIAPE
jgi:DNA-binding NarL/FixJ family response regulator